MWLGSCIAVAAALIRPLPICCRCSPKKERKKVKKPKNQKNQKTKKQKTPGLWDYIEDPDLSIDSAPHQLWNSGLFLLPWFPYLKKSVIIEDSTSLIPQVI